MRHFTDQVKYSWVLRAVSNRDGFHYIKQNIPCATDYVVNQIHSPKGIIETSATFPLPPDSVWKKVHQKIWLCLSALCR